MSAELHEVLLKAIKNTNKNVSHNLGSNMFYSLNQKFALFYSSMLIRNAGV